MPKLNKSFLNNKKGAENGFTLIELIVVMSVFLLVIGASIGIFISIVQHQRRILVEQEILNQTSYIQEYISKAIRMAARDVAGNCLVDYSPTALTGDSYPGHNFLLTRPDGGVFTGIKFINQSNLGYLGHPICQEFYLDITTTPYTIKELKSTWPSYTASDSDAVALSSGKLDIDFIRFGINGTDGETTDLTGDQEVGFKEIQPRVTFVIGVRLLGEGDPLRIIQTTVSQRNLNAQ